jgi:hypothetical protein
MCGISWDVEVDLLGHAFGVRAGWQPDQLASRPGVEVAPAVEAGKGEEVAGVVFIGDGPIPSVQAFVPGVDSQPEPRPTCARGSLIQEPVERGLLVGCPCVELNDQPLARPGIPEAAGGDPAVESFALRAGH